MVSTVVVTYEIDDAAAGVEELVAGLNGFDRKENTVGIVYFYPDMDIEAFSGELKKRLPFELVGCTGAGAMDSKNGFHEMAVTLVVLSADDCAFSTASTHGLAKENMEEKIGQAYRGAVSKLPGTPALVVAFPAPTAPFSFDEYMPVLNSVAKGVPVFGGAACGLNSVLGSKVLCEDGCYTDGLAMLCIHGNIKPVIAMHKPVDAVDGNTVITAAEGNVVKRVNDVTFVEYMDTIGVPTNELTGSLEDASFANIGYQFAIEYPAQSGYGEIAFSRVVDKLHKADGSATMLGSMPEGARICMRPMNKEQAVAGAGDCMRRLLAEMKQNEAQGASYSTIFANTCIGRYLLVLPHAEAEAVALLDQLPDGLTMSGYCSGGELGTERQGQEMVNTAQLSALVLCAF